MASRSMAAVPSLPPVLRRTPYNRTFTAFEYMQFGGGPRRCIGNEFALYEMKIVLATLLSDFRFSLANHKPVRDARLGFMGAPLGGVPLMVTARMR